MVYDVATQLEPNEHETAGFYRRHSIDARILCIVGVRTNRHPHILLSEHGNERFLPIQAFTSDLTFVYAKQSSTIALYDYHRSQFSIGLTRQF